jgi:hypothetical protein
MSTKVPIIEISSDPLFVRYYPELFETSEKWLRYGCKLVEINTYISM